MTTTPATPARAPRARRQPAEDAVEALAPAIRPWRWTDPETGEVIDSEDLISRNLNLARDKAWNFSQSSKLPYQDAEAIAFLGLVKGVRRYDPARRNPATGRRYALSTIACPFIVGELQHWLRDHGYAVRFPARWRDVGPRARRMIEAGASVEEICAACRLTPDDLEAMATAMTPTVDLPEHLCGGHGCEVEEDLLAPLRQVVADAWERLHPGDREVMERWWAGEFPSHHPFPPRALAAFRNCTRLVMRGQRADVFIQRELAITLSELQPAGRRRRPRGRSRDELEALPPVQLALAGLLA